jgi:hypothetical protein
MLLCLATMAGCGMNPKEEVTEPAGQLQLGNPWKSYDTLVDAEMACNLTFPVPDNVPSDYTAESYRVMTGTLLEVTYKKGETEITVRMKAGNDEDISGVYENFQHTETTEQNGAAITRKEATDCLVYLIHLNNHSISIYAASMAADDACREILSYIC